MESDRIAAAAPVVPKAEHIRELLDRLRRVRDISLSAETAAHVHEERLRQLVREGHVSDAHQLGRHTTRRRRATLVATAIDLEARLTDAVLDMADKLIGGLFAKARNATRRRYATSAGDVGRLMRLFHGTIEALAAAQADERDAFEAVDEAVGWAKLLRVRGGLAELANVADEDPLLRAADRWKTLRRFAPDLIEALEFRAARPADPMLAALRLLADVNRSGKRETPAGVPMPFRKEWRRLAMEGGAPTRRAGGFGKFSARLRDFEPARVLFCPGATQPGAADWKGRRRPPRVAALPHAVPCVGNQCFIVS